MCADGLVHQRCYDSGNILQPLETYRRSLILTRVLQLHHIRFSLSISFRQEKFHLSSHKPLFLLLPSPHLLVASFWLYLLSFISRMHSAWCHLYLNFTASLQLSLSHMGFWSIWLRCSTSASSNSGFRTG